MQLSSQFEKALVYATRAHCNQSRKGADIPYVAHVLGVAVIVVPHGGI
jgi:(p)ppGpp synthase/HD superfamily hydrolase